MTLIMTFDLLPKNFNMALNFFIVRDRTIIMYNGYFSILDFTDSLSSLSKEIQYRATCAPDLYPLLLCYQTH